MVCVSLKILLIGLQNVSGYSCSSSTKRTYGKGCRFTNYKDTGNPKTAVRIYSAQDADELVFLDIQEVSIKADVNRCNSRSSNGCFMPLAAGGGIYTVENVDGLLRAGADKVVVTTAAVTNPQLLEEIVERFGTQSLVAGIDYKYDDNSAKVWIRCGTEKTKLDPIDHAIRLAELGAGEILLNSIDNDGIMQGYDLVMAERVAQAVKIPVIVSGGAGNFMHLASLFKNSGLCRSMCKYFHFGDNNPIRARSYLRNIDANEKVKIMKLSMPSNAFSDYLKRLIRLHFPDEKYIDFSPSDFSLALQRCEYSFKNKKKYYQDNVGVIFDHKNADHMASFLYFLGNSIWKSTGEIELPVKLYYLNKILHSLDLFLLG